MSFITRTSILLGLIVSYIATIRCHTDLKEMNSITASDTKIENFYKEIKIQRRNNFIIGVIIGIIFALLSLLNKKPSQKERVVNFGIILLLTPMIVYILLPNKKYFLEAPLYNINITSNQSIQWFQIYKCMQNSMVIGFIVTFLISYIVLFSISKLRTK